MEAQGSKRLAPSELLQVRMCCQAQFLFSSSHLPYHCASYTILGSHGRGHCQPLHHILCGWRYWCRKSSYHQSFPCYTIPQVLWKWPKRPATTGFLQQRYPILVFNEQLDLLWYYKLKCETSVCKKLPFWWAYKSNFLPQGLQRMGRAAAQATTNAHSPPTK